MWQAVLRSAALPSRTVISVTRHNSSSADRGFRLAEGLLAGSRSSLAQAITLAESTAPRSAAAAESLLTTVLQHNLAQEAQGNVVDGTGEPKFKPCFRIGISGPPGAGKSTFIEAFGQRLLAAQHRLAVLAVDPSSTLSGGSILGDKTRMPELSTHPDAYVRPSPSSGSLGGVARNTANAIILCEGAGYDVVLVETVGVGQSETTVADMVDMFVLLVPPAGGDELQGIKRGIVELADMVIVNKADSEFLPSARMTTSDYTSAIKLMRPKYPCWKSKVEMVSAKEGAGLDDVWGTMKQFHSVLSADGLLQENRSQQYKKWMWQFISDRLIGAFKSNSAVQGSLHQIEAQVQQRTLSPSVAATKLLELFYANEASTRNL